MDTDFKIFPLSVELATTFAAELINFIRSAEKQRKIYTVALSGGNTPKLLFSILAKEYSEAVDWNIVHFFWGDERCVAPDDAESNFGMTQEILLGKIKVPEENIHRIRGESDPNAEALRYSDEIMRITRSVNKLPLFDHIILGMGDDGHTASIFPGNLKLFHSSKICDVAHHPVSGQKRITLTGPVINNADRVTFLVTGKNKAHIVYDIFKKNEKAANFPSAYIVPLHGTLTWLLDESAGELVR